MAEKTITGTGASLVKIGSSSGHTIIDNSGLLRRLNYFDGKFLRAPDLLLEQRALLNQVRIANRAGGAGVVHGYDCLLAGESQLSIGAGVAIDFAGRALMLHEDIRVGIVELIEKSRQPIAGESATVGIQATDTVDFDDCVLRTQEPPLGFAESSDLYLITLHHAEAYCGEEDVYGKLCSEACTTSTERPYIIEGIEVRATPLELTVPLKDSQTIALSGAHLRSRVASAYFEQERRRTAAQISASGLTSSLWCLGAAAAEGNGIPIAVLGRRGGTTLFLDAWTARRERMEAPPRHYWAARMMMRPWQVFLAQVLQFQCQLRACLTATDPDAPCKKLVDFDPCAETRKVAGTAADDMRLLLDHMGAIAERLAEFDQDALVGAAFNFSEDLSLLEQNYQKLVDVSRVAVPDRLMINCGIVEVPSAGYLPVNANSTVSVNEQVTRMFGSGVDLRFCVVRPDYVAHALEEAQHMERICLLQGLEDAAQKPRVDVLVPNGEIQRVEAEIAGGGYRSNMSVSLAAFLVGWPSRVVEDQASNEFSTGPSSDFSGPRFSTLATLNEIATRELPEMSGAARGEGLAGGGFSFYCAARSSGQSAREAAEFNSGEVISERLSRINAKASAFVASGLESDSALWLDLKTERNPFELTGGEVTDVRCKITVAASLVTGGNRTLVNGERIVSGQLYITQGAAQKTDTMLRARLVADGTWYRDVLANGQHSEQSAPVRLDETVIVRRTALAGLPPAISVAIVNPSFFAGLDNVQLLFERSWVSATESRARVLVRYQNKYTDTLGVASVGSASSNLTAAQASREFLLAEASLIEDSAVLTPGNAYHSASLSALEAIVKVTEDSGFADRAGKQLFPSPRELPQELKILARESWVLFHRRREKVCSFASEEAPQIRERLYRVYHIRLGAETDVEQLAADLAADADSVIAGFKPRPVTTVTFAPGLATVVSAHDGVRSDWEMRVQTDADIHIGLIASEGDVNNDGEILADARLQHLTNLLSQVSEPAEDLEQLSINRVPVSLAVGEVDGAIVYFTKAVATECHTVYRLPTRDLDAVGDAWRRNLAREDSLPVTDFIRSQGGETLFVAPSFDTGTDIFYGSDTANKLDAEWKLLGNGPVTKVLAVGTTEDEGPIATSQSARIAGTVADLPNDEKDYEAVPRNLLGDCPRATILAVELQCHDVYIISMPSGDASEIRDALLEEAATGVLTDMFESSEGDPLKHLQTVDFYRDLNQWEEESGTQYLERWHDELEGSPLSSFTVYYLAVRDPGGTDKAPFDKQAMRISNVFSEVLGSYDTIDFAEGEFPFDCPAISIIILKRNEGSFNDRTGETTVRLRRVNPESTEDEASTLSQENFSSVRFDNNNELIHDEQFEEAAKALRKSKRKIKTLEMVNMEGIDSEDEEIRAKALLQALKEEGLANKTAKVTVREAAAKEKSQIVKSDFVFDGGMVLK